MKETFELFLCLYFSPTKLQIYQQILAALYQKYVQNSPPEWTKLAWHLTSITELVSVIRPSHLQSILNTVSWLILLKCKSYFCYSSVQSPFVFPVPRRVKLEVLILTFTTLTIWPTVHFLVTLSLFSSYVAFSLTQKFFTWEWLILHSLQVFTKFHLLSKAFSCHHFQNFNPFPIISHSLFLVYVVFFF